MLPLPALFERYGSIRKNISFSHGGGKLPIFSERAMQRKKKGMTFPLDSGSTLNTTPENSIYSKGSNMKPLAWFTENILLFVPLRMFGEVRLRKDRWYPVHIQTRRCRLLLKAAKVAWINGLKSPGISIKITEPCFRQILHRSPGLLSWPIRITRVNPP